MSAAWAGAKSALDLLQRGEALLQRLEEPEPVVAELLETIDRTVREIETRWPAGKPSDVWERLDFSYALMKLQSAVFDLRDRGVGAETLRPALALIRGGLDEKGGE